MFLKYPIICSHLYCYSNQWLPPQVSYLTRNDRVSIKVVIGWEPLDSLLLILIPQLRGVACLDHECLQVVFCVRLGSRRSGILWWFRLSPLIYFFILFGYHVCFWVHVHDCRAHPIVNWLYPFGWYFLFLHYSLTPQWEVWDFSCVFNVRDMLTGSL